MRKSSPYTTTKIMQELALAILLGAAWGVIFGQAVIGMSGNFGPGEEFAGVVAYGESAYGE